MSRALWFRASTDNVVNAGLGKAGRGLLSIFNLVDSGTAYIVANFTQAIISESSDGRIQGLSLKLEV